MAETMLAFVLGLTLGVAMDRLIIVLSRHHV